MERTFHGYKRGYMFSSILSIINKVIPDKDAANKLAVKMEGEFTKQMTLQASIIQAEIKSGGITSKWRPYTMVAFVMMLVVHWSMYDVFPFIVNIFDLNIYYPQDPGFTDGLLDLIKVGLMGYIGGRSIEKSIKIWRK